MNDRARASTSVRGGWKLPLFSGVLLGASYLPGPFLPLNLTAFLPLLAWVESAHDASRRERFRAGLVFGAAAHAISMHFMYSMLAFSWLAVFLYVGTVLLLGARIGLFVILLGGLRRRTGLSFGLLLPVCWLPFEWAQNRGDLRMTGEHLYHTVAGHPFAVQFADLLGPYGVGMVLLALNGLLFEATRRAPASARRARVALAALVLLVVGYDAWAWTRPAPPGGTLRVGLVQPNIPFEVKHDRETAASQFGVLSRLTMEAARRGAKLIVWPESARPFPLYHRPDRPETYAMPEVQALAKQLGVSIIVGVEYARARDGDDYELYNAAMAVDAGGTLLPQWGAKIYLVPFTEQVPFRPLLGPLVEGKRGGQWHWVSGGFDPGPGLAMLDVEGARVGVVVCYEQLFPDLTRRLSNAGADVQVVITNDAWWARSLFQQYQANALRLRAIENRTAFVRVANTGISGFVDRRGRYHERTALFEEAVEVFDVQLESTRTVYDRVGDVVAWLAVGALVVLTVGSRLRPRTARPG